MHLYGLASGSLLGEYGSALGWPLLIASTNLTGLAFGVFVLAEWSQASEKTLSLLYKSLSLTAFGMLIISAGGFI
jgi:hypothetical protein